MIVYVDVTVRVVVDIGDAYMYEDKDTDAVQLARAIDDQDFTEFLGNEMEAVEVIDHDVLDDLYDADADWPRFKLILGPTIRKPS